jgi:hypothetical protein
MSDPGCCVDKRHGSPRGCEPETCMTLPDGATCSGCSNLSHCKAFGYTSSEANIYCSFFPRRFLPIVAPVTRVDVWAPGTILVGDVNNWIYAVRVNYVGPKDMMATCLADFSLGRWRGIDGQQWSADSPWSLVDHVWRPATADEIAAIEAASREVSE